jgi:proteasome activator subunit 4
LLHCDFLDREKSQKLLDQFQKQVSRKFPRNMRTSVLQDVDMALIVKRHAGVLGLCAFVDAFPYDVPDFLPDILVQLGNHLNDPQPIPVRFCVSLRLKVLSNLLFILLFLGDDQENALKFPSYSS